MPRNDKGRAIFHAFLACINTAAIAGSVATGNLLGTIVNLLVLAGNFYMIHSYLDNDR